jgi:glutamate:GABA antiporter
VLIAFLYAAAIKLAYRKDRVADARTVLVPGGKAGIWITGSLGFLITLGAMALAAIPPGGVKSAVVFEVKLISCTAIFIGIGLLLYWRGARKKGKTAVST